MRDLIVCFDFDGVLAESVSVKTEAFAALYRPHGADVERQVVAHHLANSGMSRFEKFRHYHTTFLGRALEEDGVEALNQQFSALVEAAVSASAPVAGSRALVEEISRQYPTYVVSATPTEELCRIVSRRGLDTLFAGVYGAPRSKADILSEIAARHDVRPGAIIMVGDAINDFRAAQTVGTLFLGRVAAGHANPFPAGVPVVEDFQDVDLTVMLDLVSRESLVS